MDVGGIPTSLIFLVNWDDYSRCMEKHNSCSKTPTRKNQQHTNTSMQRGKTDFDKQQKSSLSEPVQKSHCSPPVEDSNCLRWDNTIETAIHPTSHYRHRNITNISRFWISALLWYLRAHSFSLFHVEWHFFLNFQNTTLHRCWFNCSFGTISSNIIKYWPSRPS